MKNTFMIALLLCGIQLFVFAQASNQSTVKPKSNSSEEEVLRSHHEFFNAIIYRDVKTLERLVAEDLSSTAVNGQVMDKAGVLAITSNDDTKTELKEENIKIRLSDNLAVITSRVVGAAYSAEGKAFEMKMRIIEVWVKRNGTWQLSVAQATTEK